MRKGQTHPSTVTCHDKKASQCIWSKYSEYMRICRKSEIPPDTFYIPLFSKEKLEGMTNLLKSYLTFSLRKILFCHFPTVPFSDYPYVMATTILHILSFLSSFILLYLPTSMGRGWHDNLNLVRDHSINT